MIVLVTVVMTQGHRLGALFQTIKRLPKDYDDGKKRVEDPAGAAKPVNAPPRAPPRDPER